ncbi:MAG: hypothetical protein A2516_11355 [Alphaproteobacteria bacterium RIFOXYD12_FULL_60_8]|nr:MAG: hypothetical protein A2516_11355 [Alphaproteobacteria bacterium RIFOXYD12_FULL_60_8]
MRTINKVGYMTGQCLVAMPGMGDERFHKAVVFVCAHTSEGAMGLVINRALNVITFPELLDQLHIDSTPRCAHVRVHFGGPVEEGRGFVLHTTDYLKDSTLVVDESFSLTANVDILRDMANGDGPRRSLMALGYSGWSAGQLDAEILQNLWLTVPPDEDLVFGPDLSLKWNMALDRLGVDPNMLNESAGRA